MNINVCDGFVPPNDRSGTKRHEQMVRACYSVTHDFNRHYCPECFRECLECYKTNGLPNDRSEVIIKRIL